MGGVILVLSGSVENLEPYLKDVILSVMKQGVTVNSVFVGTLSDTGLRELALDTGGDSYYVSDHKGDRIVTTELALMASLTAQLAEEEKPILVSLSFSRPIYETAFLVELNVLSNTLLSAYDKVNRHPEDRRRFSGSYHVEMASLNCS